ncbi:13508_t:CDS:2, partial [Funneliformis caledonium]
MKTSSTSTPFKNAYTISVIEHIKRVLDKRTRIGRILAIVSTSDGIELKVQPLYYGSELPKIFANSIRLERARNGELWLSEISCLIDLQNIIEPINVWLQDTSQPVNGYQFYVSEIIYSYEGQWKIRKVEFQHQHPSEYT